MIKFWKIGKLRFRNCLEIRISDLGFETSQGTALIIMLLVISLVAAMAFGMAKLSLSEIRQVARAQDSIAAYFSAEAGLEDGLMRYKALGKNTIVPADGSNQVQRVNFAAKEAPNDALLLTAPAVVNPINNPPPDPSKYWYDLKMSYLVNQIGAVDAFNVPNDPTRIIKRDEAFQMDLSKLETNNSITIFWSGPKKADGSPLLDIGYGPAYVALEISAFKKDGTSDDNIKILSLRQKIPSGSKGSLPPLSGANNYAYVRIKPYIFYATDKDDSNTYQTMDAGGNLLSDLKGSYVNFAVTNSQGTTVLDSGITTITSTGYYGDTKRTLQVKIDRQTNTLIGLFDFTLYQGAGELGSQ